MIELFIPKAKFLFNNQYDLVDHEGNLVYRHRSSFFQTKRSLLNIHNEVIMNSKTVFGFKQKHVITQNNELIAEVYSKSTWGGIIVPQKELDVRVKGYWRFTVLRNEEEVLSITRSKQKKYSYVVSVKEDQIDFLIMLMFTIIVMSEDSFVS
ncbi:MAG: hypothetical protein KGZ51_01250 [Erysipelothrix sp.]|jgi:uncharacterized protein YxjI|nr:hypothetical protein [Erysipelothrix sp.]